MKGLALALATLWAFVTSALVTATIKSTPTRTPAPVAVALKSDREPLPRPTWRGDPVPFLPSPYQFDVADPVEALSPPAPEPRGDRRRERKTKTSIIRP